MTAEAHDTMRRSTRLALEIPVLVSTLDMRNQVFEECKTVAINAHGCGVIAQQEFAVGAPVMIDLFSEKRSKKARVVVSVCLSEAGPKTWLVGVEFETPENFWGIENPPADWAVDRIKG